jgi:hypothetical protein
MHDGPVRPSGSDPLPPIPTLPEPVAPLTSSGPSVGRFVLWQVAMLLVWGNLFFHEWHSPWLAAWIVGFVLFEALAVWDFRRQRRKWQAPRQPTDGSSTGSRLP